MAEDQENMMIEATAGPYKGQRLSVASAEGKKAIAEGWARDPFAEKNPDEKTDEEPPKELTADEQFEVRQAAEKGARRLRGEPESDDENKDEGKAKKPASTPEPPHRDKAMEADKPAARYETRSSLPRSK